MRTSSICMAFIALALTACDGANTALDDLVSTDDKATATGSGPIDSIFNGFMLSEEVIRSPDGRMTSKHFYRLNQDRNEITYTTTFNESVSAEDAEVHEVIALNGVGLPLRTSFNDIPVTLEYQFNNAGRLESQALHLNFSYPGVLPRHTYYSFNSAGQVESKYDLFPDGTTEFRTDFTYADNLLSGSTDFLDSSGGRYTSFSSDPSGRIAGWSENFKSDGIFRLASYRYDENNMLTDVEIYDETGALQRTHTFTYVETETPVYNKVLFDYIYTGKVVE